MAPERAADRDAEPTRGPRHGFAVVGRAEARVARRLSKAVSALATRLPNAPQSGLDHCDRGAERDVSPCDPIADSEYTA